MTLNLKLILELEARAAKAELEAAARGIKGVSAATTELAGKNKSAASAADTAAAATKRAAAANRDLATSQHMAAGSTGNLFAQFNDIGVMMAAGQNPLQLAIQQGSQIAQVLGPMGAGGAVRALGGAFMQLLNPINLVTFGVIAGGAALVQWATSAGEGEDAVASLDDQIKALIGSIGDYQRFAETASASTAELAGKFGNFADEVRGFAEYMKSISLGKSLEEMQATIDPLKGGIADVARLMGIVAERSAALAKMDPMDAEGIMQAREALELFYQKAADSAGALGLNTDQAMALGNALDQLGSADSMVEIRDAASGALALIQQMVPVGSELPGPLRDAADALNAIVEKTAEATAISASLGEVVAQIYADLSAAASANLANVFAGALGSANSLLGLTDSIMTRLGAVASAYAKYGPSGVIPGTDVKKGTFSFGGMDAIARGEAAKLPSTIGQVGTGAAGVRNFGSAGARSSGGAASAKAEADSLQGLIDKLHGEIDALRVQDPIQKEMLQYRKQLAGATDAERKQVEALIIARQQEALAVEGMKASKEFFEQTAVNALDALITKGESLQDVLKGVAAAFLKAAIQGALFGQGPFGAIFGGKSIVSGLFGGGGGGGGFLSSLFGGKADGGMIYGRGSGKSDSELRALSVGEFVVNAKATARNRHTLEAINAGSSIPGLAGGGMVDSGRRMGSGSYGRDASPTMVAHFSLAGARGDRDIEAAAERGMKKALSQYDGGILPASIKRVSSDPRRTF